MDARRATATGLEAVADSLGSEQHVRAVAAGKAAVGMARAVEDALGHALDAGVMTADVTGDDRRVAMFRGDTSAAVRGERSRPVARRWSSPTRRRPGRDCCVVCLSGGASAMMAVPAPGLTHRRQDRGHAPAPAGRA